MTSPTLCYHARTVMEKKARSCRTNGSKEDGCYDEAWPATDLERHGERQLHQRHADAAAAAARSQNQRAARASGEAAGCVPQERLFNPCERRKECLITNVALPMAKRMSRTVYRRRRLHGCFRMTSTGAATAPDGWQRASPTS